MFTVRALRKALAEFKNEDKVIVTFPSSRLIETNLGMCPVEVKFKGSRIELMVRIVEKTQVSEQCVKVYKTTHHVVDEGLE